MLMLFLKITSRHIKILGIINTAKDVMFSVVVCQQDYRISRMYEYANIFDFKCLAAGPKTSPTSLKVQSRKVFKFPHHTCVA